MSPLSGSMGTPSASFKESQTDFRSQRLNILHQGKLIHHLPILCPCFVSDDRRKKLREAAKEMAREGSGKSKSSSSKSKFSIDQLLDKVEEYSDRFEYELAQKFCQRALEMDPDNVRALETSGSLLIDLGNLEAAKQCFGRAVTVCPNEGYTKYMNLGQLFEGSQAVECYQKGIELMLKEKEKREAEEVAAACGGEDKTTVTNRDISNAYISIAEIYMTDCCDEDDAEDRCRTSIEKAVEIDKENPDALQMMASFLLLKEKKQDARDMIKQSVKLWLPQLQDSDKPGTSSSQKECTLSYESRLSAGKILIEVEENELAAEVLSTLLEENDEDVDIWYLIGWANYRLGDEGKDTARSYLNKAKKLYKKTKCEDPDLLKHIEELLESLGSGEDVLDSDNDEPVEEDQWEDIDDSDDDDDNDDDNETMQMDH